MLSTYVKDSLGPLGSAEAAAIVVNWKGSLTKNDATGSVWCVCAPTDRHAAGLCDEVRAIFGVGADNSSAETHSPEILYFPSWDVLPFEDRSPEKGLVAERMSVLYRLLNPERQGPYIIIFSVPALFQRIISPARFKRQVLKVNVGEAELQRYSIIESLEWLGYQRVASVEDVGQFASKGSVLDFFSPSQAEPVRVRFSEQGSVESLRLFDCATQRSLSALDQTAILPVREFGFVCAEAEDEVRELVIPKLRGLAEKFDLPSAQLRAHENGLLQGRIFRGAEHLSNYLYNDGVPFLEYVPPDSLLMFAGDASYEEYANSWWETIEAEHSRAVSRSALCGNINDLCLTLEQVDACLSPRMETIRASTMQKNGMSYLEGPPSFEIVQKTKEPLSNLFERISRSFKTYLSDGFRIIISIPTVDKRQWLYTLLKESGIPTELSDFTLADYLNNSSPISEKKRVVLIISSINAGFFDRNNRTVVFSESELFNARQQAGLRRGPFKRSPYRKGLSSLSQLGVDDFVVHELYGIGRFAGLKTVSHQSGAGDFLEIEYAEGARLYVPVQDFSKVGKYSGPDGKPPALTRLGSGSWNAVKAKVKRSIAELTGALLKTMAVRAIVDGYSYGDITPEDEWFAGLFPYQETPDQSRTIGEVLSDMGSDKPMDRLVCGDVGYGKTEVALRAAFKAVNHSRQVAILVPTTILAEQHRRTFEERFSTTAVRVAALSRFNGTAGNQRVLEDLARGNIDIVIGTHRLLQSDVIFKDLGLLIIDEEHKFGLAHKERLKRLRAELDVLSMSATPIPRSLQIALFGVRELSVIETAPLERQAVHTELHPWDDELIDGAIRRELARGGQVFVLQHYIEGLEEVADHIRKRIPDAVVDVMHGQIGRSEIEKKMYRFYAGESNVLVATAIIESGIDIPNANTIIILKAEQFGLADLYQLRGRVGRSSRQGYAYLIHSGKSQLSEPARKRLNAIASMDELGVGFKLAVQDMEIRGAGSLLGKDQSGHVQLLGYDMYMKILEEAVHLERNRRGLDEVLESKSRYAFPEFEPELMISGDAHISEDFIPDMRDRLLLYQRSVELSSGEQMDAMIEEVKDRYGHVPDEVVFLFRVMLFRSLCRFLGIRKVSLGKNVARFILVPDANNNDKRRYEDIERAARESGIEFERLPSGFVLNVSDDQYTALGQITSMLGVVLT